MDARTCGYCGHAGPDVSGDDPLCDDDHACCRRFDERAVERRRSRFKLKQANGGRPPAQKEGSTDGR